jgi:hypothetical protein
MTAEVFTFTGVSPRKPVYVQAHPTCVGRPIADLVSNLDYDQRNLLQLPALLEKVLPKRRILDGLKVNHKFSRIGSRAVLLNTAAFW